MLYVVLFFAAFSFFLYVLLGGADFGAGIMELFSSDKNKKPIKKTVYEVMGPVWEANHIWIIILIVILWIAFPGYYNILVVYLHIPLTLVLLGITLRGAAFVFRHYDAVKGESQKMYDRFFEISCLITPIFLGMTFAGMISGKIILIGDHPGAAFYDVYVAPWLSWFPLCTGLFYSALCTFLASVFLIGEAVDDERRMYVRKANFAIISVVFLGFVTLVAGYAEGVAFIKDFLSNAYSISGVLLSALLLIPLFFAIRKARVVLCRFFAGLQVLLILTSALVAHYPYFIFTTKGQVSLLEHVAPDATISVLGISLIVGGLLILPGLFHLLKSFHMIKMLEEDN